MMSVVPHLGQVETDGSVKSMPHCGHFFRNAIPGDYSMGWVREQLTEVMSEV